MAGRWGSTTATATATAILMLLTACSSGPDDNAAPTTTRTVTSTSFDLPAITAAELCASAVADPVDVRVASDALTETSGIATSLAGTGVTWAHNDSGGSPAVYAVGTDGRDLGAYALEGAEAVDWEDMARMPRPSGDLLFVGDIGDNPTAGRDHVVVYRAPEPSVAAATGGTIAGVQPIPLVYSDGPRDAETLLADPSTGDLYVVSKEWFGGPAGVYRIPNAVASGGGTETVTMERVAGVDVPGGGLVTGGDISVDGSLIALRTYTDVLLWDRAPDQSVADALAAKPCNAPSRPEKQGEAIAFSPDGRGYVMISEGEHPRVDSFHLTEV